MYKPFLKFRSISPHEQSPSSHNLTQPSPQDLDQQTAMHEQGSGDNSVQVSAPAPDCVVVDKAPACSSLSQEDNSLPINQDLNSAQASAKNLKAATKKQSSHRGTAQGLTSEASCTTTATTTTASAQSALERLQELKGIKLQPSHEAPASSQQPALNGAQSAKERLKGLTNNSSLLHEDGVGLGQKACSQDATQDIKATTTTTTTNTNLAQQNQSVSSDQELSKESATTTDTTTDTSTSFTTTHEPTTEEALVSLDVAQSTAQAISQSQKSEHVEQGKQLRGVELNSRETQDAKAEQEGQTPEHSQAQHDSHPQETGYSNLSSPHDSKFYPVVVYTPQELEEAQKSGAERILVKGQLATKLATALKTIRSMSAASLNTLALVLSGAALLAPFTGGVSLGAAGTVMGTLGAAVTAAAIAAISAIGLSLVIAVLKGYDEVKIGGGGLELVIKKHKDSKDGAGAEELGANKVDTTETNASKSGTTTTTTTTTKDNAHQGHQSP